MAQPSPSHHHLRARSVSGLRSRLPSECLWTSGLFNSLRRSPTPRLGCARDARRGRRPLGPDGGSRVLGQGPVNVPRVPLPSLLQGGSNVGPSHQKRCANGLPCAPRGVVVRPHRSPLPTSRPRVRPFTPRRPTALQTLNLPGLLLPLWIPTQAS